MKARLFSGTGPLVFKPPGRAGMVCRDIIQHDFLSSIKLLLPVEHVLRFISAKSDLAVPGLKPDGGSREDA